MKNFADEAKKMIRINSVTQSGNEEISNYVAALMQDRGMKVQLQPVMHSLEDVSKRQFNVIGILGDPLVDKKTKKGLLLNTHLDTVSPGLMANWTETGGDPFQATVKDNLVYGLGTADVKLDFLCKLHAIEKFRDVKLKMPIYLVGSCGEELGMFGTKYLLKAMTLNPKFVVVGEPSNLEVVYAHKCYNIFRISIGYQMVERDARGFNRRVDLKSLGKSAHGSYPHLGQNAIEQAIEFLTYSIENGFDIRFTKMGGGDTVNKVPDEAFAEFYLTSHQLEDFKRFFRDLVRANKKEHQFKVDFGGGGEAGVRFLPENLFECITEVSSFFTQLAEELKGEVDSSYLPEHSTVNFGKIAPRLGGVDLLFDLRLLPQISPDDIERKIKEGIQKLSANHSNLNVSVIRDRMNPGLDTPMDSELVTACKAAMEAAAIDVKLHKKATSTEAAQYFQSGYQAVVFGPGMSQGNSHSPNEHNRLDHLEKAVNFYEKLIERLCL